MKNLCLLLLFVGLLSACTNKRDQLPPNIIFIMADDLGYGDLGCYGQKKIKTPNIDRLAKEGIQFMQHYSGSTVCAPSRCALLTGMHTGHALIRDNYELGGFRDDDEGGQLPLAADTETIATLLKKAGYATGAIGKWGLGVHDTPGHPNQQGFDHFYGYLCQKQAHNYYPTHLWENTVWDTLDNPYMYPHQRFPEGEDINKPDRYQPYRGKTYAVDRMSQEASDFIKTHQEAPFFLYYPLPLPHLSLQAPEAEVAAYTFEEKPYTGDRGYLPNPYPRATYAAMVSRVDTEVGKVMKLLDKLGLDDNTLIVFTSDNGATRPGSGGADIKFFESNGPLRGHKTDLYEGGIRVPLIAHWPQKIAAGSKSDHISANWDLFPTFCEVANLDIPAGLDGHSFLPSLLQQGEQMQHEHLYWEYHSRGAAQAVRLGKWKGMRRQLQRDAEAPIELYDLATDPSEGANVANQHSDVVEQIRKIMDQEHRPSPITEWNFQAVLK